MRVSLRTESGDRNREFPWGAAIKAELESWQPERLPERFRPRAGAVRHGRREALGRAWRPLAIAAAAFVAGLMAHGLAPTPAGVPSVVRVVTDGRVIPSPSRVPVLAPSGLRPAPTATARDAGLPRAQSAPAATRQAAPARPAGPSAAPAATRTAAPAQAPAQPPATPTATPSPSTVCILGIACI